MDCISTAGHNLSAFSTNTAPKFSKI